MADRVTESIIVKGALKEIYDVWADLSVFPQFMENIESITPKEGDLSHWVVKGPANRTFAWDALTTRAEENSRIAWKSVDGDIKVSGQVTFKQLPNDEVQITVTFQYVPPGGVIGDAVAALFVHPGDQIREGLGGFKTFIEKSDRLADVSG